MKIEASNEEIGFLLSVLESQLEVIAETAFPVRVMDKINYIENISKNIINKLKEARDED